LYQLTSNVKLHNVFVELLLGAVESEYAAMTFVVDYQYNCRT